jgi:hypothetical protein
MPTLIFSIIVSLRQYAPDFIEEIGYQLFSGDELVGSSFVSFVTMPMIERILASNEFPASMRNAVGIVIAQKPPTIGRMKGQRV